MVSKFMYAKISGPVAISREGCVEIENSAPTVGFIVDQDFDELVWSVGGGITQGVIVGGENVPFGIECVVGRAERRSTMHASRGTRDPGLCGRRTESPDVEIIATFTKGRRREKSVREPVGVFLELRTLGCSVA